MSLLVSMPGRFGDILWSLPSVRALSEQRGVPIDLVIAGEFASILPLLRLQPYIKSAEALEGWSLTPPEEWRAPIALAHTEWDELIDLGYRGWPGLPLPYEVAKVAKVAIDLGRPWITVPRLDWRWHLDVAFGFSECWFELKHGLIELLLREDPTEDGTGIVGSLIQRHPTWRSLGVFPPSRWTTEAGYSPSTGWIESAQIIQHADLFFGDCSALHVLAVAIGTPVVLVEPMIARHNPIFYPLGMDGPQVTVVKGVDGLPTFDARHTAETIERVCAQQPVEQR